MTTTVQQHREIANNGSIRKNRKSYMFSQSIYQVEVNGDVGTIDLRHGCLRSRSRGYRQRSVTRNLFEKCNGKGSHSAEKQPLEFNSNRT